MWLNKFERNYFYIGIKFYIKMRRQDRGICIKMLQIRLHKRLHKSLAYCVVQHKYAYNSVNKQNIEIVGK